MLARDLPEATPPLQITCRWYERSDTKRCKHYRAGGGCALPNIATCVEWLKVNRPTPPSSSALPPPSIADSPAVTSAPLASPPSASDVTPELTAADAASFRALRVELCVVSPVHGELWLVPEVTGARRHELTPEHVLVLAQLLAQFPGAHVAAWQFLERQERRPTRRRS